MKKVKENKDDEDGQHKLCSEKKNEEKTMKMNMMKMKITMMKKNNIMKEHMMIILKNTDEDTYQDDQDSMKAWYAPFACLFISPFVLLLLGEAPDLAHVPGHVAEATVPWHLLASAAKSAYGSRVPTMFQRTLLKDAKVQDY